MGRKLSENAQRCYDELILFCDRYGYVPSLKQLSEILHCSASTVKRYLDELEWRGLIERKERTPRGIVIKR